MRAFSALAVLSLFPASAAAQDSWSDKPLLPYGQCGHAMVALKGYLYSIGGYISPNTVYRLDPVFGLSWQPVAYLEEPGNGCSAAAINGYIYTFGSQYYPPYYPADAIQCYDPAADKWTVLSTKMLVPRGESSAVTHGSSIYVIGGWNTCEQFTPDAGNPLSATIVSRADMPVTSGMGAAGSIDGRIYYTGADWNAGGMVTLEYNPGADSWAVKTPPPIDYLEYPGSFVLNARLVVTAGQWEGAPLQTWEYFPMMDLWTRRADLPTGTVRYYVAGAAINGKGYVTGGEGLNNAGGYEVFRNCDEYTPPSFGAAPSAPGSMEQRIPGGAAVPEGGTIGVNVEFTAQISDPEGDDVRLEVEAIPTGTAFTGEPTHLGAIGASGGTVTTTAVFPGGSWQWKARARDVNGNSSAWVDFGDPAAVDYVVDTVAPPTPSAVTPLNEDAPVYDRGGGPIAFVWTSVTDDRPGDVTYEIEVSYDSSFGSTIASTSSAATSVLLYMTPSNVDRYWRVRALDAAGNAGAWSAAARFRVVFLDLVDHGAGDGICASSAPGSTGSIAFLGLLITAAAAMRRR